MSNKDDEDKSKEEEYLELLSELEKQLEDDLKRAHEREKNRERLYDLLRVIVPLLILILTLQSQLELVPLTIPPEQVQMVLTWTLFVSVTFIAAAFLATIALSPLGEIGVYELIRKKN